jgi:hypothetical protein
MEAFDAAYGAKFPKALANITEVVDLLLAFYNHEHRHSGIGMHTPHRHASAPLSRSGPSGKPSSTRLTPSASRAGHDHYRSTSATREHVLGHGRYTDRIWAAEGANGIGKHIVQRLVADGETVIDVPAKLSARTRVCSTGQGRKTDAHSIALVAVRTATLNRVRPVIMSWWCGCRRIAETNSVSPARP